MKKFPLPTLYAGPFTLPAITRCLRFHYEMITAQVKIDELSRSLATIIGVDEAEAFYEKTRQEAYAQPCSNADYIIARLEKQIELTLKIT